MARVSGGRKEDDGARPRGETAPHRSARPSTGWSPTSPGRPDAAGNEGNDDDEDARWPAVGKQEEGGGTAGGRREPKSGSVTPSPRLVPPWLRAGSDMVAESCRPRPLLCGTGLATGRGTKPQRELAEARQHSEVAVQADGAAEATTSIEATTT